MDPERWKRVRAIFAGLLQVPREERDTAIEQECGDDLALRDDVASLLACHDTSGSFLEEPHPAIPSTIAEDQQITIEGFRIVRLLARGGMGEVWLAEQESPQRPVAIKLLLPGVASHESIRRFTHEAQFLAHLQHPGIARIFETGTVGVRPYYVMEYVEGLPLTHYAEQNGLATSARISLIAGICDAVQHAHQKGIVHRDLKPANILVDAEGRPKVLDFGVARATDADLNLTTFQTDAGRLIGTLAYMSPEQALGDPLAIDTRSDVYALGVVLHELLSGRLPHDLEGLSLPSAVRFISEHEPPRLGSFDRTLRGDIETIVLKALAKERERRYQAVSELAEDLRRCLQNEPILARPPSSLYLLRKFVRRNRPLVAGVVLAVLALTAGIIGTTTAMLDATRSEGLATQRRKTAEREVAKSRRVQRFLNEILAAADPLAAGRADLTVREALDFAARRIDTELAEFPEVESSVRETVGSAYMSIGLLDAAEPHLRKSLDLAEGSFGSEDAAVARSMDSLGALLQKKGESGEAEALLRGALAMRRRLLAPGDPEIATSLTNLGILLAQKPDLEGAETCSREALAVHTGARGEVSAARIVSHNLARSLIRQRKLLEAEAILVEALAEQREHLDSGHPILASTLHEIGELRLAQGRFDEATEAYRKALAIRRKQFGDQHEAVVQSLIGLANVLVLRGEATEAGPLMEEAAAHHKKLGRADTQEWAVFLSHRARLLSTLGRHAEAVPVLEEALALQRRIGGEAHPYLPGFLCSLACELQHIGELERSESGFRDAIALGTAIHGGEDGATLASKDGLAMVLRETRRAVEAERMLADLYEACERTMEKGAWQVARVGFHHGLVLFDLERLAEAEPKLIAGLAGIRGSLGSRHTLALACMSDVIRFYDAWGKKEKADEFRQQLARLRPEEH